MSETKYKDTTSPLDERVEDLMSRMTLKEKMGFITPSPLTSCAAVAENSVILSTVQRPSSTMV